MRTFFNAITLFFFFFGQLTGQIKISEIYTGGQSSSALYKNDWVELYNSGSSSVTMNNWSVQYASSSSSGTTNFQVSTFSGTIQAFSYFLVRVSSAGTDGADVSYDISGSPTISFGDNNGKVALCNSNTALTPNTLFTAGNLVDFVGYGTANQYEGPGTITGVSKTVTIQRKAFSTSTSSTMQTGGIDNLKGNGYDSDNNNSDLFTSAPEPQTKASSPENPGGNTSSPQITSNKSHISFGSVSTLSVNIDQFNLLGANLTEPINLSTSLPFQISIDNANFSNTINIAASTLNNASQTIYVRFVPTQNNQNYTGTITIQSTEVNNLQIILSGNTIDHSQSLEAVCWNIEWFSDGTNNGPDNDVIQETNVLRIFREINADVYGLGEIVDTLALKKIVDSLGSSEFGYYVGKYASGVADANNSSYPSAQKLAYIYRKSMIQPLSFTPLFYTTNTTDTLYNYWASGRFPLMMVANVTIDGITQTMSFVLIHAKAQNSSDAYDRRKRAARALKNYLDTNKPNERIIIFGDLNDDLDQTIAGASEAADYPLSSYSVLISDSTRYKSITLPLSYAGLKSTVAYNDVIDHIITSDELQFEYINASATILKDLVVGLISNYGTSTSDHYPVFARFSYQNAFLPVKFVEIKLQGKGNLVNLSWTTAEEENIMFYDVEKSEDGYIWVNTDRVYPKNKFSFTTYDSQDPEAKNKIQYYRIKVTEENNITAYSKIVSYIKENPGDFVIYPNPATNEINFISPEELLKNITILSTGGTVIKSIEKPNGRIHIDELRQGTYLLKIEGQSEIKLLRFVKI